MSASRLRRRLLQAAIVLGALVAALALVVMLALRDNPARHAQGQRASTRSGAAEIHYFVRGPANTTPVVLLPSYGRSASDFNELVVSLNAAGHRTLAIQPRGVDGSTLPSVKITLHTLASDIDAVLTAERVAEPVVVVGHAYGNRIARSFATDFPERTRALVLLAAGGEAPTPRETAAAISKALFAIWPEDVRRNAVRLAFFARSSPLPEHWLRGWYPWAGLAQARATAHSPFAEWGAGGRAAILVLQPSEDAVAAGGAEALRGRYPERVRVVEIADAGHALLPEQPERVETLVLGYLASTNTEVVPPPPIAE